MWTKTFRLFAIFLSLVLYLVIMFYISSFLQTFYIMYVEYVSLVMKYCWREQKQRKHLCLWNLLYEFLRIVFLLFYRSSFINMYDINLRMYLCLCVCLCRSIIHCEQTVFFRFHFMFVCVRAFFFPLPACPTYNTQHSGARTYTAHQNEYVVNCLMTHWLNYELFRE